MSLRTMRMILWSAVIAVALAASIAVFVLRIPLPGTMGLGGGDYALVEADGTPFSARSLEGRPSLLFFGFTYCPDVCPTTLFEMASWREQLGPEAERLGLYFVTVDPERDTPDVLGAYVAAASPSIHGVTGAPEEIGKMMAAWKASARKVPMENGEYTMDHTASVYLVDTQGRSAGLIGYGEDVEGAIRKIRALLSAS